MTGVIRRIAPGDGPDLRRIRLAALQTDPMAFASTHSQEVDQTAEMWEAWAAAAASGPDQSVFVAESEGKPVGLAGGFRTDATPAAYHLFSMWVDPAHRGAGHGARLTSAIIDWAETAGGSELSLWIVRGNTAAAQLYSRLGFTPTGATQPLPHDQAATEIEMARPLSPPVGAPRDRMPDGYIEFEPMTGDEFERYLPELIEAYAEDLVHADGFGGSDALERATIGVAQLLPGGATTPFHQVCTLRAGLEDVPVGAIWFGSVAVANRTVTFIYDLTVNESHRKRGFGSAALAELEEWSRLQRNDAVALHLFEHKATATRFFEGNGYAVTESDPGHLRMEKPLD